MKFPMTFGAIVTSVLGAALPEGTGTEPSVTITFARNQACNVPSDSANTVTVGTQCMKLPLGTESLRVVKMDKDVGKVRYNSLRVYHNDHCNGFGDIEPAWGCAAPGAQGCICSVVSAYKSIRLVVDS